jgi:hypothetical protein
MNLSVNGHPPQQRRARCHFNEAVNAKTYERNAARNGTCNDGYQTL